MTVLSVIALVVAVNPSSLEAAEDDDMSKVLRIATAAALGVNDYG